MNWFIFFLAITISDAKIDYEFGINQVHAFASEEECEEWLADDANYDAELDVVSAVYSGEITFGCASDRELPGDLLPGVGI